MCPAIINNLVEIVLSHITYHPVKTYVNFRYILKGLLKNTWAIIIDNRSKLIKIGEHHLKPLGEILFCRNPILTQVNCFGRLLNHTTWLGDNV